MRIRHTARWVIGALTAAALSVTALGGSAQGAAPKLSEATTVGVHNAYEKATYTYFANALDSGSSLLEIDIWTDSISKRWRVSHSNPLGNDNNCEKASTPGDLYRTATRTSGPAWTTSRRGSNCTPTTGRSPSRSR